MFQGIVRFIQIKEDVFDVKIEIVARFEIALQEERVAGHLENVAVFVFVAVFGVAALASSCSPQIHQEADRLATIDPVEEAVLHKLSGQSLNIRFAETVDGIREGPQNRVIQKSVRPVVWNVSEIRQGYRLRDRVRAAADRQSRLAHIVIGNRAGVRFSNPEGVIAFE